MFLYDFLNDVIPAKAGIQPYRVLSGILQYYFLETFYKAVRVRNAKNCLQIFNKTPITKIEGFLNESSLKFKNLKL